MRIDVNQTIDNAKLNSFHIILAILGFLFTVVEGFEMICLGLITKDVADDWGIAPQALEYAHLAVLIGILLGSLVAGIITDKIGRRKSILLMFTLATVGMGLSFFISNMNQMIVLRLVTGFGAGGALPIAIALISEYAPLKYRNIIVVFAYAGAPFASYVGGYFGNYFIDALGWQGIFVLGVALASPILVWMYLWVPESVKYMVLKDIKVAESKELLVKVDLSLSLNDQDELFIDEPVLTKGSLTSLFSNERLMVTSFLWLAFIAGQFIIYIMSLWLPTILQSAGWEAGLSRNAVGHYYLGASIGGIIIGYLADKYGASKVLIYAFPLASVLYYVLGQVVNDQEMWFLIAPFAGAIAVGSTLGLAPLAASLYPTSIRGTGVGASLGVGRIGSIITPMIGASIVAANISATDFYMIAMIAPVISSISIIVLVFYRPKEVQ